MNRWQALYAVAHYHKIFFSIALLVAASLVQFKTIGDVTYGAKAAMFATGAASALFVGLIPSNESRLATFVNRFVAATLTFFAGWNWLLSETDGDIWGTFSPAILFMALVTFGLLAGVLSGLLEYKDKTGK